MSVVINTNFAATVAANNLTVSNAGLQRSLNRLSSGTKIVNPADDAGGLAVSMQLTATSRRQSAVKANLLNSVSFLQSQDGVLATTGRILDRISELKTLYGDATKNASDRANYQAEFVALQAQLASNAAETFNGMALFGTTGIVVPTTESGTTTVATTAINLNGTSVGAFAPLTDNFADLSNWTGSGLSVSGNVLHLLNGTATSVRSFSGAFSLTFDVLVPGSFDWLDVQLGGSTLSSIADPGQIPRNTWHSVRINFDGAGTAQTYIDGSGSAAVTQTGISATSGAITLSNGGLGANSIRNFSITSTGVGATGDVSAVATASDLGSLSLTTITDAIARVANGRAENGASQSRLGFAADLVAVNKANIEAANSRITDVDVAQESTNLARWNILVQSGTAMLSQANQSARLALKLLSN